jgi:type I restriction enzyme, R subunit
LIVKTGIANAIAEQLGGLKGNKDAISETIENNVRSKIIKEHLNDPAYYERMSALLDEIIKTRKAKALDYEAYLKRIGDLIANVVSGGAETAPQAINTPGKRALFNNLKNDEALALRIDETVKASRPDAWRGVETKERAIKAALFTVLKDINEVERIFVIVKAQSEY